MNILHYSLGFPPYRTGGMTKYCMDLIEEQLLKSDKVSLLWPGKNISYTDDIIIKKRKNYKFKSGSICRSFEMCNPMPVSLLDGIIDVDQFTRDRLFRKLNEFFTENKFDVFHIHTLMGLPKECIIAAKKANVRIIFTTHDYFGLCPKCSFIFNDNICTNALSCIDCAICNKTALSLKKIKIMQSPFYRFIKQTYIVKKLRKRHIKVVNYSCSNSYDCNLSNLNKEQVSKYVHLRSYYINMLKNIDIIHFNSENTKRVYEQYLDFDKSGRVISISNKEIKNHKKIKNIKNNKIYVGYLGPQSIRKGFFDIIKCIDELGNINNIELVVYNGFAGRDYIKTNAPYTYKQLPKVMNEIDVLVVPSRWNETFGFTVLEALSYGVPVIVSSNVGAKDLIENGKSGYIFNNLSELTKILKGILQKPSMLDKMNAYIVKNVSIKTMKEHEEEIKNIYIN